MVILLLNISIVSCTSTLNSRQGRQLKVVSEDFMYSTYLGGDDSLLVNPEVALDDQIKDVATYLQ